jgi:hypothetical protein
VASSPSLCPCRQVLRDHNCLQTLLQHLTSHSLTIVSNACGTLWNLSARSPQDQELLWDLGAVGMLRNLVHSTDPPSIRRRPQLSPLAPACPAST